MFSSTNSPSESITSIQPTDGDIQHILTWLDSLMECLKRFTPDNVIYSKYKEEDTYKKFKRPKFDSLKQLTEELQNWIQTIFFSGSRNVQFMLSHGLPDDCNTNRNAFSEFPDFPLVSLIKPYAKPEAYKMLAERLQNYIMVDLNYQEAITDNSAYIKPGDIPTNGGCAGDTPDPHKVLAVLSQSEQVVDDGTILAGYLKLLRTGITKGQDVKQRLTARTNLAAQIDQFATGSTNGGVSEHPNIWKTLCLLEWVHDDLQEISSEDTRKNLSFKVNDLMKESELQEFSQNFRTFSFADLLKHVDQ
ncbi:unnamed protein product [Ambrosiozyma monospora]|uniref:Unnamed protein product n=1 Tax=Ambrosiozyma monospora TaxID=43982 RepID=A0ACB5TWS9_AMBMO|nr:unnamed protein product [Ambrosiozyma monospora]